MYNTIRRPHLIDYQAFRLLARLSAAVLLVSWLALVIVEAVASRFAAPSMHTVYQGIALAIVFAGYAIGWRKELVGGVLAIAGTLAFFAIHSMTLGTMPGLAAAFFALPGILYLMAWYGEHAGHAPLARQ